jgi:hypothetical protein
MQRVRLGTNSSFLQWIHGERGQLPTPAVLAQTLSFSTVLNTPVP